MRCYRHSRFWASVHHQRLLPTTRHVSIDPSGASGNFWYHFLCEMGVVLRCLGYYRGSEQGVVSPYLDNECLDFSQFENFEVEQAFFWNIFPVMWKAVVYVPQTCHPLRVKTSGTDLIPYPGKVLAQPANCCIISRHFEQQEQEGVVWQDLGIKLVTWLASPSLALIRTPSFFIF